jgi:hypothetical protein
VEFSCICFKVTQIISPNTEFRFAKDFICRLCKLSSLQRYDAKRALKHPWITRNLHEKIPLTRIEEMQQQDAHHTFARVTRLATFLSIIK